MMEVLGNVFQITITGDKKKNGNKACTRKEPALPENVGPAQRRNTTKDRTEPGAV